MPIGNPNFLGKRQASTSGSEIDVTTSATAPAGSSIVLCIRINTSQTLPSSVTDDSSNSYSVIGTPCDVAGLGKVIIYRADNVTELTSGGTISVTLAESATTRLALAYSIAGLRASGVTDVDTENDGDSATPSAGDLVTTFADEMLICFIVGDDDEAALGFSAGSGWTEDGNFAEINNSRCMHMEWRIVSSTGTYTADGTFSGTNQWCAGAHSMKGPEAADTGPAFAMGMGGGQDDAGAFIG